MVLIDIYDDNNYELLGSLVSALPGERQTNNRAEMWPAIILAKHVSGDVVLHTDSLYLTQGFSKGRHLHPTGANADLWYALGCAIQRRQGNYHIQWVRGHITEIEVLSGTQGLQDYIGNGLADAMAGYAADRFQIPHDEIYDYMGKLEKHKHIMQRILHATYE